MVYAFNGIHERDELWINLSKIATQAMGHWTVGGDFNCVPHAIERLGGTVNTAGTFSTWNNKQPSETRVYSILDRLFINHEWSVQLPDYFANYFREGNFDHTPCLVSIAKQNQNKCRPFKYLNMWSKAPDFHDCVAKAWAQTINGTRMYVLGRKLKLQKRILKKINRNHFSDVDNRADLAQTELIHIQKQLVERPGNRALMKKE
ncbi:uncharacterized protein LOC141639328 [Silene latifolia]|uniref:uncharacterized protein LOC141639328 n=1 Tax=Silene latifolia TaxID=37657 RepID=UPI003D7888D6